MSRKKDLVKNTFILFVGKLFTQLVSFLLLPLYTAYLTTSQFGTVDLVITYVYLLSPIITLQLEKSVFRFLIDAKDDIDKQKKILSISLKMIFIILFIFIIATVLISSFIKINYITLIFINISLCMFSNYLLQTARGLSLIKKYTLASVISGVSNIVLNLVFILGFKIKIEGMLLSVIISNLLVIIYLIKTLKIYKYIDFKLKDKILLKEMLKYSLPLIPNDISWWVISVSDRTIISFILGIAYNGIYTVSNKFSVLFIGLFNVFGLSWTEEASKHINDEDKDQYFTDVINTSIKIFSSVCIMIIIILPLVFNTLVNIRYISSYNYIPILLLASLVNIVVSLYSAIYIAKKLTKKVMNTSLIAALVNIVLNLLFIKYIGLYAAALSTLISYLFMMIYRYFDVKKYINIKYDINNIINILILLIISITTYYINNKYLSIIILILNITTLFIMNIKEIDLFYNKFIKKLIRRN